MRRLLIAGSRGAHMSMEAIDSVFASLMNGFPDVDEPLIVVTGGARGADTYGDDWARAKGHISEIHKADWDKYGKRAGYIRNQEMVDSGINFAIIFWDGKSRGTANTMKLLRDSSIDHVIVITYV